ncbi:MAG: MBL fold metallo-hydrolase [Kofleriaceae bacterium]
MFRHGVWFDPMIPRLPGAHVVSEALLAGNTESIRAALMACATEAPDLVRLAGLEDGGMLVTERLLFPEAPTQWQFRTIDPITPTLLEFDIDVDQVEVLADFLRDAGDAPVAEMLDAWPAEEIDLTPFIAEREQHRAPLARTPGIYRREHASLVIQSHTTRVLIDPIGWTSLRAEHNYAPPALDNVDAIALTHSHGDHWHVPSLLISARRADIPVIVPVVPRPNFLCETDFVRDCALLGQTAHALAWHNALEVGDIKIEALPFYGEQPTRDAPGPASELRNWGNCYRVTTPQFSCILLVDGGTDPLGSIADACRASCERHGPVDAVLSCQREFGAPFFGGSLDWPTLPYARLQELQRRAAAGTLPSSTAGTLGAAEAAIAAGARYFLPYANGFEGIGRPIRDIGWGRGEPSEADCNARMVVEFERRGAATRVVAWNPGEVAVIASGGLVTRRSE